jgi:hypothetical protein
VNFEQAKDYYKRGLTAFFRSCIAQEQIETKEYLQQAISMFELSYNNGNNKAKDAIVLMKNKLKAIEN